MAIKRSTTKTDISKPPRNHQLDKKNPKLKEKPQYKMKTRESEKNPDVIVDFEYHEGLIFIVIENIGNDSAYNTTIRFNKKILGMQKTKNISSLKIFQSLKFLPPGKKIKIFVDLFQFYLRDKQPLQIKTFIFFRNKMKQTLENSIQHDLSIYKDILEINHVKKII